MLQQKSALKVSTLKVRLHLSEPVISIKSIRYLTPPPRLNRKSGEIWEYRARFLFCILSMSHFALYYVVWVLKLKNVFAWSALSDFSRTSGLQIKFALICQLPFNNSWFCICLNPQNFKLKTKTFDLIVIVFKIKLSIKKGNVINGCLIYTLGFIYIHGFYFNINAMWIVDNKKNAKRNKNKEMTCRC